MATVTIGKSYFESLIRRAEFHTDAPDLDPAALSQKLHISRAEYEYLVQATREYNLLKGALFRGGLAVETLNTLLTAESGPTQGRFDFSAKAPRENAFASSVVTPDALSVPALHMDVHTPRTKSTASDDRSACPRRTPRYDRSHSFGLPDSLIASPEHDGDDESSLASQRLPYYGQRTILIGNLSDRTNYKDIIGIIRGGRLLHIHLRNDRSATVSFMEGAHKFLAYAKGNDIYLHAKRLTFGWAERQFHVPPYVANKIAAGASRNIVIRGATGRLNDELIRDHLDHIHNLVVVDIKFEDGDAYISTNSVHSAMFARTCMMSRSGYKGLHIAWYQDECSAPLPAKPQRMYTPAYPVATKPIPITNRYTILDGHGTATDSEDEDDPHLQNGVKVANWADAATT